MPLLFARTQMARGASTASDKAGKARRAQPETRRGRRAREKREIGREERRRGGEGLRLSHLQGRSRQGRPSA